MPIGDELRQDVEALATAEGRLVGSAGYRRARTYLTERIRAMGLDGYNGGPIELPYTASGASFTNIIARVAGTDPSAAPVLLAAHYDTAGALPGADDNAAAIAILLSMVPALQRSRMERDVLLAFFDGEEPPFFLSPAMGSVYFYRRQRTGPIHCGIVLDLVGHDVAIPGLEDLVFVTGAESDPGLGAALRETPEAEGMRVIAALNRYIGDLSDHHAFRTDRKPYLFLSCGHWPHYHRASDTPEKLNYGKMAAIAEYLVRLVETVGRTALDGPFEGYDSTPVELHFMRRTIGPLAQMLGMKLESRSDIDRLAAVLVGQFGL